MKVVPLGRTRLHSVVPMLTMAAAYAVAAWLGLWLAIPPGYATGIWPASGLALAGLLMGGTRVWPGIWFGSLVVNLGTGFDATHTAALLTSVAIPASLGLGATLQALVGASLVRRAVDFPSALTDAYEIGAFLLLGGPVSCLLSATVGATTLAVSGQIPWGMFVTTWGTWWVGDTLGVLIAAPLVLSWLAEPRAIWRRRRVSVALPLVGALVLAFVVFEYTRAQEWARLHLLFERQAESLAHAIDTRLDEYLDVLHAFKSFYTSAPEMSRQGFHTFVQRSLARHPGLQALSLDLRVPDAQRDAYEQAIRREGFPDFQITEQIAQGELVRAERRPEYVVVTYIEPYPGNERALGFDVVSTSDRLDALQRARDTAQTVATGRLTLVQEPGRQSGLLVFLPVYDRWLPSATVEQRRQSLQGYVTGMLWIGDVVDASLRGMERQGIVLRIEDETAPADQRLLYDSRARAPKSLGPAPGEALGEPPSGMHWQTTVELAGRRWGLRFAPTLGYLAARQSMQPWAVLGGGLAFTSLLGAFLLIVTGRTAVIEELMVERTAQLEDSQRLEAEAAQRRRIAESLAEIGRLLSQSLDSLEVGQRIVEHVRRLLQAQVAVLYQIEPSSGMLVALAATDDLGPVAGLWRTLPPKLGMAGLAVRSRQPVVTPDLLTDPHLTLPAAIRAHFEPTPVRAVLSYRSCEMVGSSARSASGMRWVGHLTRKPWPWRGPLRTMPLPPWLTPSSMRKCRLDARGCRPSHASSWRLKRPSADGLPMNSTMRLDSSWPPCISPWRRRLPGCRWRFGSASIRCESISMPLRPSYAASRTNSVPPSWTI